MKKLLALILAVVMCLSFAACGDSADKQNDENTQQSDTEKTENGIVATPIKIGDKIDNKNFTMTFESIELLDEYSYKTSEYSSTSCYVEEGYKLLLVKGHFTNNSVSTISDSAFSLTATVNGEYVVDGHDVRLNFIRSKQFEIDAYTDLDYILYINIPEKLAGVFETVTFDIGFKNDMGKLTTTYNTDGTVTVDIDTLYSLSGGIESSNTDDKANSTKKTIAIGDTISAKNYEFKLSKVEFTYELLPSNTSSVYSSYPAESGKVYVHVAAEVKNTMQRDIRIDELFTASAIYDGSYNYNGFTVVDDDNRFDWVGSYVAATPLETCKAHSLIECPVEVDESGKKVTVLIEIDGEQYEFTLR